MKRTALAPLLALAVPAVAQTQPGAISMGWAGHVDTDLSLAFLGSDHTLMGRFMLQHPNAGQAPIFATKGAGAFSLVKADYGANRDMRLVLTYGNRMATYLFPKTQAVLDAEAAVAGGAGIDQKDTAWHKAVADRWFHVALVRSGTTVKLFLNGTRLTALSGNLDASGNLSLSGLTGLPPAASTLRLGQLPDATQGTEAFFGQFYGLMDDVAAISIAQADLFVKAYASNPEVDPNTPGLLGLYNFNYNPAPIPVVVAHTPTQVGAAYRRLVSADRVASKDKASYLPPQHKTVFHLPFNRGVAYQVMWGNEVNSHVGGSSFSWDFWRIGAGWDRDDSEAATNGAPLRAAARGRVVRAFDGGDAALDASEKPKGDLIDGYNVLVLNHTAGEETVYMHVKTGSINEAFSKAGYLFSPTVPNNGDYKANADWLKQYAFWANDGDFITRIGTRDVNNYHLHFSSEYDTVTPLYDAGKTTHTFPLAFSDYEASDDQGATWHYVTRGVPSQGQWVRNPVQ